MGLVRLLQRSSCSSTWSFPGIWHRRERHTAAAVAYQFGENYFRPVCAAARASASQMKPG
jgi:hypothetical protein